MEKLLLHHFGNPECLSYVRNGDWKRILGVYVVRNTKRVTLLIKLASMLFIALQCDEKWCENLGGTTVQWVQKETVILVINIEYIEIYKLIHSANPTQPGRDHCFRTCCPSVRPSPLFKSRKTNQQKTMFATGVTMGLAEWIIDDTCLIFSYYLSVQRS